MTFRPPIGIASDEIAPASHPLSRAPHPRPRGPRNIPDPLLSRHALPLHRSFYPLGFPVRIHTNSAAILDAAEVSWSRFNQIFDAPPLELRLGVSHDGDTVCPPSPLPRAQGHLLSIIANPGNFVVCDLFRGFGYGWVDQAALKHPLYLRYHLLEAAVLCMISVLRATPVHAACIARHGRGILLCGDSGAGKSTLAFACAREGWTFLSDDASYLVHGQTDTRRVVGNFHQVRFRPSATILFPEFAGLPITPRAEGKPSIEVPTRSLPGISTAPSISVDFLVVLRRRQQANVSLRHIPSESLKPWLRSSLFPTPELQAIQLPALDSLLDAPTCELRYSGLDQAISALDHLAREGLR